MSDHLAEITRYARQATQENLASFIKRHDGLSTDELAGLIIRDFFGPVDLAWLLDQVGEAGHRGKAVTQQPAQAPLVAEAHQLRGDIEAGLRLLLKSEKLLYRKAAQVGIDRLAELARQLEQAKQRIKELETAFNLASQSRERNKNRAEQAEREKERYREALRKILVESGLHSQCKASLEAAAALNEQNTKPSGEVGEKA